MPKKKQNVLVHPKHRWFIWTIVIVSVIGIGLASYISITAMKDKAEFDASYDPRPVAPPNY